MKYFFDSKIKRAVSLVLLIIGLVIVVKAGLAEPDIVIDVYNVWETGDDKEVLLWFYDFQPREVHLKMVNADDVALYSEVKTTRDEYMSFVIEMPSNVMTGNYILKVSAKEDNVVYTATKKIKMIEKYSWYQKLYLRIKEYLVGGMFDGIFD